MRKICMLLNKWDNINEGLNFDELTELDRLLHKEIISVNKMLEFRIEDEIKAKFKFNK